jgi:hypothetical protein
MTNGPRSKTKSLDSIILWKNSKPVLHHDLQKQTGIEIPIIIYYRLIHAAALRMELNKHPKLSIRHEYWRVRDVLESLEKHEVRCNGNQTR